MADTMQFDLVSPERRLASGQATAVRIPGADGDLTAMPLHAPVVATLRPGILSVDMDGGTQDYAVTGGFAQITAEGATVLADEALPKDEVTAEHLTSLVEASQAIEATDETTKRIADLQALGAELGLSM
ncbi:MAG: F0F1 ATP synthase subunit epsilon [Paracoccaceae bacterium]